MSPRSAIKAVIFDMDGVLTDSQGLHVLAEIETTKKFGMPMTKEELDKEAGRPDRMGMQDLVIRHGKSLQLVDEMMRYKYEVAMPHILEQEGLPPIPSAIEVVKNLSKKYPCAVASSSPHAFISFALSKIGILDLFRVRISVDDLPEGRGKPNPDIFLLAAKTLGVDPQHCAVIEDASHGVAAAKAAGMFCIGLQSPNSGEQDLSKADVVVSDMEEVIAIIDAVSRSS